MSDYVFIADAFIEQIVGGGELNNEELIHILRSRGHSVSKKLSFQVTPAFLEESGDKNFIIGNFIGLNPQSKVKFEESDFLKYVIYEHDHKYLISRNPAHYKDYKAPKSEIINQKFYKKSKRVLCQTSFHKSIIEKNLSLKNIKSVGGNLWSEDILDYLSGLSKLPREETVAIMDSPIEHKNTYGAVKFCEYNSIPYKLIPKMPYKEFLREMSKNKKLAFFPKTPETCSRILVESRMANMGVFTNNKCGAKYEEWFSMRGDDLIQKVFQMRESIVDIVEESYEK
jgi:hypothetical protein